MFIFLLYNVLVLGLFFKKVEIRFVFLSWCSQAQSLLQWHDSHQYCSKTGQPTQRNVAGSKRVCHASGITYYPQVSIWTAHVINTGSLWWQANAAGLHGGEHVWSELLALLFDAFARCLQWLSPWCLMGAGASSHDSPHFPRGCTLLCQASVTWVRWSLIQHSGLGHAGCGGRVSRHQTLVHRGGWTDTLSDIREKHIGSK